MEAEEVTMRADEMPLLNDDIPVATDEIPAVATENIPAEIQRTRTPTPTPSPSITDISAITASLHCTLKDHGEKVMNFLYCQFLEESSCCDLKIHAWDGVIPVHTCVMMACCPPIAKIIMEKGMKRRASRLDDLVINVKFHVETVHRIVQAIYSGVFNASGITNLLELYKALKYFGVEELESVKEILERELGDKILNDVSDRNLKIKKRPREKPVKKGLKKKKKIGKRLKAAQGGEGDDNVMVMKCEDENSVVYSSTGDKKGTKKGKKKRVKREAKIKKPRRKYKKRVQIKSGVDLKRLIGSGKVDLHAIKSEVLDDDFNFLELSFVDDDGRPVLKCIKCKKKFTDMDELKKHIDNHPTFPCDKCTRIFYTRALYCRHRRCVHLKGEHLKCTSCDFVAEDPSSFSEHCLTTHQITQPFRCQHEGCGFKSDTYRYLSKHFEAHEDYRAAACGKCGKVFKNMACLTSHKRSCYQAQCYLCDVCGQSFNHATSMKTHRQAMHFGQKPFQCKVCDKSFSEKSNLKRHLRIHNNTYPYACPVCAQQFRHSNTLKSHLNRHGGADNFDIAACKINEDVKLAGSSLVAVHTYSNDAPMLPMDNNNKFRNVNISHDTNTNTNDDPDLLDLAMSGTSNSKQQTNFNNAKSCARNRISKDHLHENNISQTVPPMPFSSNDKNTAFPSHTSNSQSSQHFDEEHKFQPQAPPFPPATPGQFHHPFLDYSSMFPMRAPPFAHVGLPPSSGSGNPHHPHPHSGATASSIHLLFPGPPMSPSASAIANTNTITTANNVNAPSTVSGSNGMTQSPSQQNSHPHNPMYNTWPTFPQYNPRMTWNDS